jgi:hypothetical protein
MNISAKSLLAAVAFCSAAQLCSFAEAATVYTSDANLSHFTSGISKFATFSNYQDGDVSLGGYTPTVASLNAGLRVFSWDYDTKPVAGLAQGGNWIIATFKKPEATIRVFPNIDHVGEAYDGYQYQIWGSNDGATWTPLFDATGVSGSGEPFTLGSFTGTAPTRVDNVLTPGAGPGGTVGYIADFSFNSSYKQYAFGTSTVAGPLNSEQELSGVAAVPEPATWAMLILGLGGVGASLRKNRNQLSACRTPGPAF